MRRGSRLLATALGAAAFAVAARARPPAGWSGDLDEALASSAVVVALAADPSRPCSASAREALDEAWDELRPRAARVLLARAPADVQPASALALFVYERGELAARRDGPFDAELARTWLGETLDELAHLRTRPQGGEGPGELFASAESCLRRGLAGDAEALFASVAARGGEPWVSRARERLARCAIERGDVARAREQSALAGAGAAAPERDGDLQLTRGLIELAERDGRRACAALAAAAELLEARRHPDAPRARLELARALEARGEGTLALAELAALRRDPRASSVRAGARALADSILAPETRP